MDEIATDALVTFKFAGDEHFRPHTIGRGDERTVGLARQTKDAGEAADRIELGRMTPFAENVAVTRDRFVTRGNVNAGVAVAVDSRSFLRLTRIL